MTAVQRRGIAGISIVIPSYGDPSLALRLVQALKRQETTRRCELIVVDDASPTPFPTCADVHVLRRTSNGGFGSAVNTGAAVASEAHLLVLNSDLILHDNFIESLCDRAESWQPAVVGVRLERESGGSEWAARCWPRLTHFAIEWFVPLARWRTTAWWHRAVGHDPLGSGIRDVPVDWVVGAVLLVPTAAFRRVGGFDERFFMNSEEVDLQRRLTAVGVRSVYLGSVTVGHVGGASSGLNQQRIRWVLDGRVRYLAKWQGAAGRRRFRGALLVVSVANLLWNSARRLRRPDVQPIEEFRWQARAVLRAH